MEHRDHPAHCNRFGLSVMCIISDGKDRRTFTLSVFSQHIIYLVLIDYISQQNVAFIAYMFESCSGLHAVFSNTDQSLKKLSL